MKRYIATLYNANTDGLVWAGEAESEQAVCEMFAEIMGCKYVHNDFGQYLVYEDEEPDFEETQNCWAIAVGECNENGFAHDAVQW